MTISNELSKYKYEGLDGAEIALNQQVNIYFSVKRQIRIMN
jgi:hypothetical protein